MAIEVQDIKSKPSARIKGLGIKLVGYNNEEFKQIPTSEIVILNENGKISNQYLDFSALNFKGVYNASNNTPSLSDSTGLNDDYYIVNVSGSQNLGSGILNMKSGDNLVYSNNKWNLIPMDNKLVYNNDIFTI